MVGIPLGKSAPFLSDNVTFSVCIRSGIYNYLFSIVTKQLAYQFNFKYRYIDDILSINNSEFENYLGQMYPIDMKQRRHDGE